VGSNKKHPYEKNRRDIIRAIRDLYRHREPLNIHAIKRLHPDLLRKVYSIRPFWGWAREDSGLDYRKIHTQLLETITCQICGKEFRNLTFHLPVHDVTTDEYKSSFPDEYMHSESLRAERSDSLFSQNQLLATGGRYGNRNTSWTGSTSFSAGGFH
jgi:ROS/MUCR transcriptional regulator protein